MAAKVFVDTNILLYIAFDQIDRNNRGADPQKWEKYHEECVQKLVQYINDEPVGVGVFNPDKFAFTQSTRI